MKTQAKALVSRLKPLEILQLCNEKLVCAARDLAEFTQQGINAAFIVSLAHKCDYFESTLQNSLMQDAQRGENIANSEVQEAVAAICKICEVGQEIFMNDPRKYQDYLIQLPVKNLENAEQSTAA